MLLLLLISQKIRYRSILWLKIQILFLDSKSPSGYNVHIRPWKNMNKKKCIFQLQNESDFACICLERYSLLWLSSLFCLFVCCLFEELLLQQLLRMFKGLARGYICNPTAFVTLTPLSVTIRATKRKLEAIQALIWSLSSAKYTGIWVIFVEFQKCKNCSLFLRIRWDDGGRCLAEWHPPPCKWSPPFHSCSNIILTQALSPWAV